MFFSIYQLSIKAPGNGVKGEREQRAELTEAKRLEAPLRTLIGKRRR
jgi:hypothetical protein